MKCSSLIIGHVCRDKNTDYKGEVQRRAGGAALYSSAAAWGMGHDVCVLTKVAPEDGDLLDELRLPKERVLNLPTPCSTRMENVYFTADRERRRSVCAARGEPFCAADVPEDLPAEIFQLAGLVYGDYADDMIPSLAKRGRVAVDVQGYLRHVNVSDGGTMFFEDWAEKRELLPYIDFLKTDAAEAEILTGLSDRAEAAKLLASRGAGEVLITHNTEVLVCADGKVFTCPIKARNLSGRTGRGDTTFAVYLNERLHSSPETALRLATAAVSLKMETPGPFAGTRADVEAYLREFYD